MAYIGDIHPVKFIFENFAIFSLRNHDLFVIQDHKNNDPSLLNSNLNHLFLTKTIKFSNFSSFIYGQDAQYLIFLHN